jgi:hypothetical protein
MDNKTNAIVFIVVAVIFLFIVIAFKIKSDKKRKSLSISTADRVRDIGFVKNESLGKKPYLWGIPSWGLALLTMFLAFVVLMVLGDILTAIFKISESDIGDFMFYILYNLIIAGGCFYICRQNPRSIWYVPVLCNIIGIMSAIIEPNFWISSLWIVICSGWVLSIIASLIGARLGSKKEILSNQ